MASEGDEDGTVGDGAVQAPGCGATQAPGDGAVGRVLAVDLGGTNLRVAVVGVDGELCNRRHLPSAAREGPEAIIATMVALLAEVAAEADLPAGAPVGIACPGPLNPREGVVYHTPNLAGWHDVPLGPRIAAATGRRVSIGNDGNLAALGEVRFGAARGARDLVYLALGTGVGAGVVSGGRLIDGTRGLGAELGHTCVALDGPRCTCGNIGCLETYASGWAIAREASLVMTTDDGAALRRAAGGLPPTAGTVSAAATAGDPAALAILARAGRALGAALGSFINTFNPELVVFGGGVATLGDHLLRPAHEAVRQHAFPAARADVRYAFSALGADTGLYRAAALALGAAERNP